MAKKIWKSKIVLTLEEIDALDDLLDLYLDGEFSERGINREALLQIQEQVGAVMEVINLRLGFTDQRIDKDVGKFLMLKKGQKKTRRNTMHRHDASPLGLR